MPYDDIPTENAPALAPRVDDYLFEIDLAGIHPDGNPRSTLDDLDLFSPDGGKEQHRSAELPGSGSHEGDVAR